MNDMQDKQNKVIASRITEIIKDMQFWQSNVENKCCNLVHIRS